MRKKVSCFSTRVWAGFLALLGFASCTSNEDPEDIPLEYGTPTVGFQVQGVVTDEEGNPLEDIQVIVRRAYNNDYRSGDTIYTDNKGAFAAEKFVTTGFEPDEQKVYFNDEKKVFKSDSILLKDMKLEKIEEGVYLNALESKLNIIFSSAFRSVVKDDTSLLLKLKSILFSSAISV